MIAINTVKRLLLLLCLVFIVSGCGYQNSASEPNKLPEQFRKVAIAEVSNPTLERWLEPDIRSGLRDEITRRGQLTWVETPKADALFKIRIVSFSNGSRVLGIDDKTLKYDSTLRVQMRVTDAADGHTIWSSGTVSVTESYFSGEKEATNKLVVKLMIRRLVDRMNQAY